MRNKEINRLLSIILIVSLMLMSMVHYQTSQAAKKMSINKKKVTLTVGKTYQLKVKNAKKVTWKSSKKSVASVNKKGLVTAKKKGNVTITGKVRKKSFKCKVTVNNGKIKYISERSVEYNSVYSEYRIFFSLLLADELTRVSSSGTASIKINNSDNIQVYNKNISFSVNNFGYWIFPLYGRKYICCIKVPSSQITPTSSTSGTLSLAVTLSNGFHFAESLYSVSNLPFRAEPTPVPTAPPTISLKLPEVPMVHNSFTSGNVLRTSINITNIRYETTYTSYNNTVKLELYLSGAKTYDSSGSGQSRTQSIGYKLFKNNDVVDSGSIYTPSIAMGDTFTNADSSIYNLTPGASYELKILDTN